MDLLPFVHMFQFYYYLIWMGFDLVAGIRVASFVVFRLSLGRRGLGSRVSGLGSRVSGVGCRVSLTGGWDCCHLLSYG